MLRCSKCGRQLKKGEVCQCSADPVTISEPSRHLGGLKIIIALIVFVGIAGCVIVAAFLGKGQSGESFSETDVANGTYSVTENKKDVQSESADEQTNTDEQTEESVLQILQAKYQEGELEYIDARKKLNEIDTASLEGEDVDIFLELSENVEQELMETAETYAEADEYENLYVFLEEILSEVPKDSAALKLRESYKRDCLHYLEERSASLMDKGYKKKAKNLLQNALTYYPDPDDIQELLDDLDKQIQEKKKKEEKETESILEKDYIFENSDSSYLKESDLENMSIKEINYAKNEIYARHGRTFQSRELQDYFNSKKWYQELDKVDFKEFDAHPDKYQLNDYELKNAVLLRNKEFSMDSKGYQLDQ